MRLSFPRCWFSGVITARGVQSRGSSSHFALVAETRLPASLVFSTLPCILCRASPVNLPWYWKLSLMVHPDKCSHPQAHQAFIKLNKSFKDLQDPDKRKSVDEKIKLKEEQEAFKAELKALREAAQWRRLQGISMEG
ncbi:hypothetical protein F0562_028181 [Nyssa sinensis]|uniref:J domain-containing protein n=1 Tax=Nyssa sinensis TaxID=561372 RepID=A0A5J5B5U5_9ASTE|nr:hypothetical protein F0562_028181 [Nyssa sinensis]